MEDLSPAMTGDTSTGPHTQNLREVADQVPPSLWLAMLVSTSERFAFYGLQAPFQNYIQNPRDDSLHPGALGLGQSTATSFSYLFTFLVYTVPIFAAPVIDCYLGRYRGLVYFTWIYLLGVAVLLVTSLPPSLDVGAGLPVFVTAILIISVGLGGVKACMSPFIADQYTRIEDHIIETKAGERMLAKRSLTIEYIYSIYYWAINLGSLAGIGTTFIEKRIGFWAAYLLPFCVLWVSMLTLLLFKARFVSRSPSGNILPKCMRIVTCAAKNGFNMDAAKASVQPVPIEWNDAFVADLKRALAAYRVFAAFPVLWLLHTQILNNLVSQAATTETNGFPNDVFNSLNPLAVLLLLPLVQKVLYPQLRKANIVFPPINRLAVGFLIESLAIAYCAGLQYMIYSRGPCYSFPLQCDQSQGGSIPNRLSVWLQTPIYIVDALGEIFFDLGSQEYAYNMAPEGMKSIMQAMISFMSALGAVLGWTLVPATRNPRLVIMYGTMAGAMFVTAVIFWLVFREYEHIDLALVPEDPQRATTGDQAQSSAETGHSDYLQLVPMASLGTQTESQGEERADLNIVMT